MKLDRLTVEPLVESIRRRELSDEQWARLEATIVKLFAVLTLVEGKGFDLERLVGTLPGYRKRRQPAGPGDDQTPPEPSDAASQPSDAPKPRKGHGRIKATDYRVDQTIECPHPSHAPGDRCPSCEGGLYQLRIADQVQLVGSALLQASLYRRQVLRCGTCGETFTAPMPKGVADTKFDPTADATFAVYRYGMGMPFYRLMTMLKAMGIPLSPSTMFAQVARLAQTALPIYLALQRLAASAGLIHTDDTGARVLSLMKQNETKTNTERRGIHTTGVVAVGRARISLFYTGWRHAGENLDRLLEKRGEGLDPPVHMADALSRNPSKRFHTIIANCLAHAFRKFRELEEAFPTECGRVLTDLGKVYEHDDATRGMTPAQRLAYHQRHSGPIVAKLGMWVEAYEERGVEPNGILGKSFQYLLNHWDGLTAFLRIEGAPLDNNLVERTLKVAIRHRRNSLFYKTEHGAFVGDVLMSLIHTCRDNGVNPFAYLADIGRNPMAVRTSPDEWLPWVWVERQEERAKKAA